MIEFIKVALEDVQNAFDIRESLFEKYFVGEILKDEFLVSLANQRASDFDWQKETPLGGAGTTLNAVVLYCLIKHYNLNSVIETGVSGGYYSSFILSALKNARHKENFLLSLELSGDTSKIGKFIPENLKDGWDLIVGKSSLDTFKEWKVSGIEHFAGLYCHDSLHTLSHMLRELHEFKQSVSDEFFIFIDDQNAEAFWDKALAMKAFDKPGYDVKYISGKESRLQGHLGGFLKYERKSRKESQ